MKQSFRHISLSVSFLMLFVSYQVCITCFSHVHYVNGVMIAHSHPYADDEHSHSEATFSLLADLSHFSSLITEAIVVSPPNWLVMSVMGICPSDVSLPASYTSYFSLRAPPYCVSI